MNSLPLSPWLRRIQQNPWFQLLILPAVLAAGASILTCSGTDLTSLSWTCIKGGLFAGFGVIVGAIQRSFGSASFNKDGTVNQPVIDILKVQQADPIAAGGLAAQAAVAARKVAT